MANSRFEYTRNFEKPSDALMPDAWIVIRIDGRGFHGISTRAGFEKPNDAKALALMNKAAEGVLNDVGGVVLGYGHSDEYSFVLPPDSSLFSRRESKLVSTIVSTFTAHYVAHWSCYFRHVPLVVQSPDVGTNGCMVSGCPSEPSNSSSLPSTLGTIPTFDGRAIVYPTVRRLREYLSWRQVDCHVNNLYNTTFHNLVQRGSMNARKAEDYLKGTLARDKHEILFSKFGINYNKEPEMFKKGSVIYWDVTPASNIDTVESYDRRPNAPTTSSSDPLDGKTNEDSVTSRAQSDRETNNDTRQNRLQRKKEKKSVVVSHAEMTKGEPDFWKKDGPGWRAVQNFD